MECRGAAAGSSRKPFGGAFVRYETQRQIEQSGHVAQFRTGDICLGRKNPRQRFPCEPQFIQRHRKAIRRIPRRADNADANRFWVVDDLI